MICPKLGKNPESQDTDERAWLRDTTRLFLLFLSPYSPAIYYIWHHWATTGPKGGERVTRGNIIEYKTEYELCSVFTCGGENYIHLSLDDSFATFRL
jgi:hypothetical protein